MIIAFATPLALIGADEENVYFADYEHIINGLPYVRSFTKEWQFEDGDDIWFGFECETY